MDPLRVMTFNVRLDTPDDGDDAWPQRRALVADTIRYHAPDVVGLQEPLAHQLDFVDDALDGYEWVGKSRGAGEEEGEHTPIGFRADRFALTDTDTFWLSETPDEPGSVGWDGSHPRVATWARLDDATADRPLVHLNTHLDNRGQRARNEGAALVAERLRDLAAGATPVVTGDFNCLAGELGHARLDGLELGDGRRLESAAETATFRHGPDTTRTDFHDLDPGRKLDHVFVATDCSVATCAVVTDRDEDRYPSDHLPVVAGVTRR
jgi:endonuclease/exonuclease/phosphatase family metal-dependent hydrolase